MARDTFVDFDHSLAAAVNKIREALGDSAENPRFVETLPKKGYRFIGQIRREQPAPAMAAAVTTEAPDESARAPQSGVQQTAWLRTMTLILIGVAATLGAVLAWTKWRPHAVSQPLTAVPFTSYPGLETAPAFSPDGSRIAFAWNGGVPAVGKNAEPGYDLYVKAIGSETRLRLTNHPSEWISPAWSPDGTQIAFHRLAGPDTGIYVVPALGGPERKLRATHIPYNLAAPLSWSRDGKWIAHADTVNGQPGDRIFLLSVDTLEDHEFRHDPACNHEGYLTFSHSGEQLAWVCVHTTRSFELMTSDAKGGSGRSLARFSDFVCGIAWAADDRSVLVPQASEEPDELVEVWLSGAAQRKVPLQTAGQWPSVPDSGRKLAFSSLSYHINAWRKDLKHPEVAAAQILPSSRWQNEATYSPDGKHIAFDSSRSGIWSVWLTDADGSNLVQISHDGAAGFPRWSADSQKLVYDMKEADGNSGVYVADVADRVSRKVKTNVGEMTHPSWSSDGKWIYFRGYPAVGHRLYRCPATGGDATVITSGRDAIAPLESYDGKTLYFAERGRHTRVKTVSLGPNGAVSESESFVEGMPPVANQHLWTVAREGIYFVPDAAPRVVSYFDFATRRTRELFTVDKDLSDGLSVSPDGRYLLFAQLDEMNSEIMLVEKFR